MAFNLHSSSIALHFQRHKNNYLSFEYTNRTSNGERLESRELDVPQFRTENGYQGRQIYSLAADYSYTLKGKCITTAEESIILLSLCRDRHQQGHRLLHLRLLFDTTFRSSRYHLSLFLSHTYSEEKKESFILSCK